MLRSYLLIIFVVIFIAGCAPSLKQRGMQAYKLKEYQHAVDYFKKALEEKSTPELKQLLTEAQVALEDEYEHAAKLDYQANDLAGALKYYKKASAVRNRAALHEYVVKIAAEIESIERIADNAKSTADTNVVAARKIFKPIAKYNLSMPKVAKTKAYIITREAEHAVHVKIGLARRSEKLQNHDKTDTILKKAEKILISVEGLNSSTKKGLQKKIDLFKNTILLRRSIKEKDTTQVAKYAKALLRLDSKNEEAKNALNSADTFKAENLLLAAEKDMRNPHILPTVRMIRALEGYCAASKLLKDRNDQVNETCRKMRVAVSEKLSLASEELIKQTTGAGFEAIIAFLYLAASSYDQDNKELSLLAEEWREKAKNRKKDNIKFSVIIENTDSREMHEEFLDIAKDVESKYSYENGFPVKVKIRFLHSSLDSSQPLGVQNVISTHRVSAKKTKKNHKKYTFQKYRIKHVLHTSIDVVVESRETGIQQKCHVDELSEIYVNGTRGVSPNDTGGYKQIEAKDPDVRKLLVPIKKAVKACLNETIVDVKSKAAKVRQGRYGKFSELFALDRKMMPGEHISEMLPYAERRLFTKMFGVEYSLLRKQL